MRTRAKTQLSGIAVVHDGDGHLLSSGPDLGPHIERVLASGSEARNLLLSDRRRGHRRDGVRGRVAIRRFSLSNAAASRTTGHSPGPHEARRAGYRRITPNEIVNAEHPFCLHL